MSGGLLTIILHLSVAILSFAIGFAVISPHQNKNHPRRTSVLLALLAGIILFSVGSLVAHWLDITPIQRLIFAGLIGLGLLALWRGVSVKRHAAASSSAE